MSSKKSDIAQSKRTSHYYKKKLSNQQQQGKLQQNVGKMATKIQKKPKEAKIRAKQARQRKKKYIQSLEEKIEILQKQLNKYRENSPFQCKAIQSQNSAFINLNKIDKQVQQIQTIKQKLSKKPGSQFSEEIIKLEGIQGAFKRLYRAVSQRNENQAVQSVNVLRERFGVAGQDRMNWIRDLFLKIVDIQMPLHCRLLLQHCEHREQFYKLLGGSESLRQFRKVYFDQAAISTICQSRSTMMEIKQQYKKIMVSMEQLSYDMFEQARRLQCEIDRIQNSMNPLFVGRILVYLDMERKETQNLQEIFPVNYYKRSLIECFQNRETMKYECDIQYCKEREEERLERLSMLSQEENFLKDFFSD